MIKAIVYDLDGMLFKEPHYFTEELERKYGIPLEESPFSKDPRYQECKKGKISLKKFLSLYHKKWKKYPKFKSSLDEIIKEWFDFTHLQENVLKIAENLQKKGILNLILTNNSRERIAYLDKKFNLSKTFQIIGSFDLGILKPDQEFYRVLEQKLGLKNDQVLIFDDKEETVKLLKGFGFNAEIYESIHDLQKALKKYGVS